MGIKEIIITIIINNEYGTVIKRLSLETTEEYFKAIGKC